MDSQTLYNQASLKTADNLKSIAESKLLRDISSLTLPEIEAAVNLVSQVVPAGNVPAVILSGLARLTGRKPPAKIISRDINLLFKGVDQALDRAVYGAFFAGPAAVIWGYQNLLKLAGKDPEDSFPEGTWQFYVDYALREDTARHANETCGFDLILSQHRLNPSAVDRVTAWVMAAIHCLHHYPSLLENEWRERVYLRCLVDLTRERADATRYARLYRAWEKQRPYERDSDVAAGETYPAYRRRKFDQFLAEASGDLPADLRSEWVKHIQAAEAKELSAYQRQMSILAYLEPGPYGETRTPIALKQAHVGVIYRGHYYLLPACAPGANQPADVATIRAQVATLMADPVQTPSTSLTALARIKRATWPSLRQKLNRDLVKELDMLRRAPILLNFDPPPHAPSALRNLPLAELRQAERGVGDHALTIFATHKTFVFDQSHIFFDGAWGAALAEIITNEALAWAAYLNGLPAAQSQPTHPYRLTFPFKPAELKWLDQASLVTTEVDAETEAVNVRAMLTLRRQFKQRSDLIELTLNDLLVLYRAIHAVTYRPAPELVTQLRQLSRAEATRSAAEAALQAIRPADMSPAIVIPVDASLRSPRDRLHPITLQVPLYDLDLLNLHRRAIKALDVYSQHDSGDPETLYTRFNQLRKVYLRTLAEFGRMMGRTKEIALAGETFSVGTIKMLAHLPPPLQRALEQVPNRFEVLNDLIRGREVFSNLGAVASGSSLTRFITAKDDNDKKTLAWGIITDARGVMRITLRDFRPHVALLVAAGHKDLATKLVQHYLDTYASGLNHFISDLRKMTETNPKPIRSR
jgi:hypothetical protein